MSRLTRYFLGTISALIAGLAILVIAVTWRLQQGPISIGFLSPYVQEALQFNDSVPDVSLSIEDCVLVWRGFERGLDISVVDARLMSSEGSIIATFPEIAMELDSEHLLAGKVRLRSLDIIQPVLRFGRNTDGSFDFGIGKTEDVEAINRVLLALVMPAAASNPAAVLRRIAVTDAIFHVEDGMTGLSWQSRDADLLITRDKAGVSGDLQADLDFDNSVLPIGISARLDYAERTIDVGVDFVGLLPEAIAPLMPHLEPLKRIGMPITGGLSLRVEPNGSVGKVGFSIVGRQGSLDVTPLVAKPIYLTRLEAEGEIDMAGSIVVFNDLLLTSGSAKFESSGSLSDIDGATINLVGKVRDWTAADLRRLWPESLLPPVRDWYVQNVSSGFITDGSVHVNISAGEVERREVRPESIRLDVYVGDVAVKYLRAMPEFIDGIGKIQITPNSFDAVVESGQIESLPITEGSLNMTLGAPKLWKAEMEFVVRGGAKDVLTLINKPPLSLVDRFSIVPSEVSGESASRLRLRFPVRRDLKLPQIEFAAASNIVDLSIPNIFDGFNLADATMNLAVNDVGLDITGHGQINNAPAKISWNQDFQTKEDAQVRIFGRWGQKQLASLGFSAGGMLEGEVAVDLSTTVRGRQFSEARVSVDVTDAGINIDPMLWEKAPGVPGKLSFLYQRQPNGFVLLEDLFLTAGELHLAGLLELSTKKELSRLDLSRLVYGENDVSVSVRQRVPEGFIVALNGAQLNLEPFIESFFASSDNDNLPPFSLSAQIGNMRLSQTRTLSAVTANLFYDGQSIDILNASGSIDSIHPLSVSIATTPRGIKKFKLASNDAGSLARTTGLFDDARGGSLLVTASLRQTLEGVVMEGKMAIKSIKIINAPLLAKILTLASLSGIAEILNGEGILFARADVPFHYDGKVLRVTEARAFGPSLGITLDGEVSSLDKLEMVGTLVPAYTINAILGQIPLIGRLLIGREGEGLFALTYNVRGNVDSPVITVNPLMALAPGFLRNFFSVFVTDPDPPKPEEGQTQAIPG